MRRRLRAAWLQRGASALELRWVDSVFDPGVLTVGFARRVPTYKRLTLMLRDGERLTSLLLHADRPVQVVVAGKSHPADEGGKALIKQIVRFADDPAVRHRIVFLPDYDMSMAKYLYWGCDVWLNNPTRPLEACGTSGMKSALNGGLNLSIRDGWWDEHYDGSNGWAIPTADGVTDVPRRDDLEAAALYDLLGNQVAPLFYDRDDDGVPAGWLGMVRHTLASLGPKVQAGRMVREYVDSYYLPAASRWPTVGDGGFGGARELAAYRAKVADAWPRVRVLGGELTVDGRTPPVIGATMRVRAMVDLAGLDPSDVDVQVVVGRVDDADELRDVVTVSMRSGSGRRVPGRPAAAARGRARLHRARAAAGTPCWPARRSWAGSCWPTSDIRWRARPPTAHHGADVRREQRHLEAYDTAAPHRRRDRGALSVTMLGPLLLVMLPGGRGFVTYRTSAAPTRPRSRAGCGQAWPTTGPTRRSGRRVEDARPRRAPGLHEPWCATGSSPASRSP